MQRFCMALVRGPYVGRVAQPAAPSIQTSPVFVAPLRAASSSMPPAHGPAETIHSTTETSAAGATQAVPHLDPEAAEQVRIVKELGEQAFGENTDILKKVAFRGLRSFVVCAVGMIAFMWAMKKKRRELEASARPAVEADSGLQAAEDGDPTRRYLQEMRELGFDVDTLEAELEQERLAKAAVSNHPTEL
ncbi:hypothetical protein JKF63_01254 [Porcisia hertigi]|uniref:Uncharacterized protein n=1 Tax=Porcisia hertigi TaxID=2761500 RepID=A0A836HXQ8_9TRYP|nr:hypothetical protein JKF63_01254 [Porcisia hertigi]